MTQELFADNAVTSLSSSPAIGATSFTVAASSGFPAAVTGVSQFRVIIDTEIVTVTNVSGTTWTCAALAAGHSAPVPVTHVITAAGLDNFIGTAVRSTYVTQIISELSVTTTANLTLGAAHACTLTSAAYTVTLPTPVGATGQQVRVRVTPNSTKLLTLATASGNIDGLTTRIMWAAESATLQSDGTNWVKIGGKTIPMLCAIAQNAAQSVPTATLAAILLDTTNYDNTGLMATLGSHGVTIRRPGLYSISVRVGMDSAPAASARTIFYAQKNGASSVAVIEQSNVAGTFLTLASANDATFAVGDTLQVSLYQSCGSAWSVAAGLSDSGPMLALHEIPAW